jgi:RHS repeat-associated protein
MAKATDFKTVNNYNAMLKLKLSIILLLCFLSFSNIVSAQTPFIIKKFVCPTDASSTFIYDNIKAGTSDGWCNSGSQLTVNVSGPTSLGSVTVTRLDGGPHRAQVNVTWNQGQTGTLKVDVYFRKRTKISGWFNFDCQWSGWNYMYTYELRRESTSPSGAVMGNLVATVPNDQTQSTFNLTYLPSPSFPNELTATKVRYQTGRLVNGLLEEAETSIIKLSSPFSTVSAYQPVPITFYTMGKGAFQRSIFVFSETKPGCGEWYSIAPITLNVYSSCYQDDVSQVALTPVPVGPVGNFMFHPEDKSYTVDKNQSYTITVTGITDFSSNFTLRHDGGGDLTLTGNTFSINQDLGSYRIEAFPNDAGCPVPKALQVLVGGQNIDIVDKCTIKLVDKLTSAPYNKDPLDIVLQHFAAYVESERSIIVSPGVSLELGAELFIKPGFATPNTDLTMNFIESTSYDEYGRVLSSNRSYFDERGLALQTQQKDLTKETILANATLYDAQGRPAIATLSAPVIAAASSSGCPNDDQSGSALEFSYKPKFVTAANGLPYNYTHFDLANENSPAAVDASQEGTLGWYYSSNNGTSANPKFNEPLIATTQYPYSRTLFYKDGSSEVKGATKPGDAFRAGSAYLATANKEPVDANDAYFNTDPKSYLSVRERELGFARPATIVGEFYKTVSIDEMGKKSVAYVDKSDHAIISLYYGTNSTPITTSYNFYDNAGRLLVSISPNGYNQYAIDVSNQSNFNSIDKTKYFYNNRGLLEATEEKVAGQKANGISRTEYLYKKDGKIRFSQNEEQRNANPTRYSYTNYDKVERPTESGEFTAGATAILFNSPAMLAILENSDADGGLPGASGAKSERISTLYDEKDTGVPLSRVQRFVAGSVSRTKKENVATTWYSYDELGRVEWMIQDIVGLGVKTIDYRYGPTGAVQEVAYQKGNTDDFTHFYEYDKDNRLKKVYTTRETLVYDKLGKLTNPGITYSSSGEIQDPGILEHQATYHYYLHGPLKRVELSTRQRDNTMVTLQGIDYLYTVDGSLKSINHASPAKDPGGDGTSTSTKPDAFGMTLDYYPNDYVGAAGGAESISTSAAYVDQYSGLIKANRWHGPVEPDKQLAYAYQYDQRNQFSKADWGTVTGSLFTRNVLQPYYEAVGGYDANGNISNLQRNGNVLKPISNFKHDFSYNYKPYTNMLQTITQPNAQTFRSYQYNDLGQMTQEVEGATSKFVTYDVTGKVVGVYADAAKTQPITLFTHDDRGFRVAKTSFDENFAESFKTWYVRDNSGNEVCTYVQDMVLAEPPSAREVPLYGSGKLGLYMPDFGISFYELTDHLGNVRAVMGEPDEPLQVETLATMETERNAKELEDFENLNSVPTGDFINHTPQEVVVDRIVDVIANPNKVNRINNRFGGSTAPNPIGVGSMMLVHPGDVINAEVFVKYADFNQGDNNLLAALAGFLTTAFPGGPNIDGSLFNIVNTPEFATLPAWSKFDNSQPRAFLNYLFFDKDNILQEFDFDQVSSAAAIPQVDPELHTHERLFLDITVKKEGYLYVYVSNQSDQNMDVYFDDLRIKHTYSSVAAGGDFYPFGLSIADREIIRENYRYGYQGQFAERDEETGWSHFELRDYDPTIGRWMIPDPKRSGFSPYFGMDNNPVLKTDPDGGCPGGCVWLLDMYTSFSYRKPKPGEMFSTLRYFKPSVSNPRMNLYLGYGYGSRARLGGYDGKKVDWGNDLLHGGLSLGTSGLNFEGTVLSAARKGEHGDGTVTGIDAYFLRFNLGYAGNNFDMAGGQAGYGFNKPWTASNYIDNEPPTIIDTGIPGIPEIGLDKNYGFLDFFKDLGKAIKNYVNEKLSPMRRNYNPSQDQND